MVVVVVVVVVVVFVVVAVVVVVVSLSVCRSVGRLTGWLVSWLVGWLPRNSGFLRCLKLLVSLLLLTNHASTVKSFFLYQMKVTIFKLDVIRQNLATCVLSFPRLWPVFQLAAGRPCAQVIFCHVTTASLA